MIVETYFGSFIDMSKLLRVTPLRFGYESPKASFTWTFVGGVPDNYHFDSFSRETEALLTAHRLLFPNNDFQRTPESLKNFQDELNRLHDAFIKQWMDFHASRNAAAIKIMDIIERDPLAAFVLAEMLEKMSSHGR